MTELDPAIKSEGYEFSGFHLDAARRELTHRGEPVDLQNRVFDLLVYLLEHRDRTVPKDELQDAVWPGTIVTEAALSRAVMKARKALGDDASNPELIKTVHGQGFRFIADVAEVAGRAGGSAEVSHERGALDREARRAAVLRTATTYGAVAWLINQAAGMVWEAFEWDKLPIQILLGVSLLGFPIAVALAWFYRSTPTGLRLRSEAPAPTVGSSGRWGWSVAAVLALALALSLFWQPNAERQAPAFQQVAVLPLHNDTGDSALAWTELGLMGLLNAALADVDVATVSPAEVLRLSPSPGAPVDLELIQALSAQAGADQTLAMRLERSGGVYVVSGVLHSTSQAEELPAFTADSPSAAAAALAGYLSNVLQPQHVRHSDAFSSDDVFIDQAFARGMHEMLSGNLADARDLLEVARAGAPKAFWPAYELAVVQQKLGELNAAKAEFERLLAMRGDAAKPREVARIHNGLGIIADLTGRLDDAQSHYSQGLAAAEAAGIHDVRAVLWINAAVASRAQGKPGEARERLGNARAAYSAAGVDDLHADFYISLGNVFADGGDLEGARRQYQQALENARVRQTLEVEGIALSNLSWAAQHLGDYEAAASYLAESEALRQRIGDQVGVLRSRVRRATLAFSLGQLDEAQRLAAEILSDEYAETERDLRSTALAVQGEVALAASDPAAALARFDDALGVEQQGGTHFGLLRALLGKSRAEHDLGELERSAESLAMLNAANAGDDGIAVFTLRAERQAARIDASSGRVAEAEERLRLATDAARRASNQAELAVIASDLAALLIERGAIDDAEAFVGIAADAAPDTPEVLIASARLARARGEIEQVDRLVASVREKSGERFGQTLAALSLPLASP